MKKFITSIFLLCICSISFAQTGNGSLGLVRINGTVNFYNSVHYYNDNKNQRNGTAGFSTEIGAKQFLGKSLFFLEETAGFVFSELPLPNYPFVVGVGGGDTYPLIDKGNELGFLCSTVIGYQIPIKNNLSIDVFAGPDFRYLFKYNAKFGNLKQELPLYKANLRLKAGAGLNIQNWNVSLFVSPDLLDRGKGYYRYSGDGTFRYRTIQVGFGITYYFKWN